MTKQMIIAIGRQFGSGGHYVAEKIAEDLGISYYDRRILEEIAKEHNVQTEYLEKYDEKRENVVLSRRVNGHTNSIGEILAEMQFSLLKKKAASGESFVIVGRCAEEIFRGDERLISAFILADREDRIQHIAKQHSLSRSKAWSLIRREDNARERYHNQYAQFKWGDPEGYDLCINCTRLGIDGTAAMLETYIKERIGAAKS